MRMNNDEINSLNCHRIHVAEETNKDVSLLIENDTEKGRDILHSITLRYE